MDPDESTRKYMSRGRRSGSKIAPPQVLPRPLTFGSSSTKPSSLLGGAVLLLPPPAGDPGGAPGAEPAPLGALSPKSGAPSLGAAEHAAATASDRQKVQTLAGLMVLMGGAAAIRSCRVRAKEAFRPEPRPPDAFFLRPFCKPSPLSKIRSHR
jgi:hypothetical protein